MGLFVFWLFFVCGHLTRDNPGRALFVKKGVLEVQIPALFGPERGSSTVRTKIAGWGRSPLSPRGESTPHAQRPAADCSNLRHRVRFQQRRFAHIIGFHSLKKIESSPSL